MEKLKAATISENFDTEDLLLAIKSLQNMCKTSK